MSLNLESMDAEPATPVAETPEPPPAAAAPSPPPIEGGAVAAVPAVERAPAPEAKHELIPLAKYLDERATYKARIAALEAERDARAKPAEPAAVDFMENPQGYVDQKIQFFQEGANTNDPLEESDASMDDVVVRALCIGV